MPERDSELLNRLLAIFRVEADEHLQALSSGLAELEKQPEEARRAQLVENLFREAHSLKGAARAVNLREIERICQPLESAFAALKSRRLAISPALSDLLYRAVDAIGGMVTTGAGMPELRPASLEPLFREFDDVLQGASGTGPHRETAPSVARQDDVAVPSAPPMTHETVRVSTQKLDAVMRQAEELLSPQLAAAQRFMELREVSASFAAWKKQRARLQPVLRLFERAAASGNETAAKLPLQALPKLLESLEAEQLFMKTLEQRLLRLGKSAAHDWRTLSGMSEGLLHDVKEMQMLPISSLFEIAPHFIRELARDRGKRVELVMRGGDIEVDRHILEEMKAPLIHLLRNSIDHGIEAPDARRQNGKPENGTLTIAAVQQDGSRIEILVSDDGAGVDTDKVRAAARRLGIDPGEVESGPNERETLSLVFQSGLSTSEILTDVSGRGLGLAIVAEKVNRLGGAIVLESRRGEGASFRIALPLTLATFRGVLVRVGEHLFIVPARGVERVAQVAEREIGTVENRAAITLDGLPVALADLGETLELPRGRSLRGAEEKIAVIVLGEGRRRMAFRVDEILDEQEVLVKPLGRQLEQVRNVAGASVLGTGKVVVVLDTADLLKSAVRRTAVPVDGVGAPAEEERRKHAILVAEDSITSRTLLKNILEVSGYEVATAVDGVDAYTVLKNGAFDLLVSDVEMPRMDGFDLTAKLRADRQLGELPVVLVTALESREHRERGADVGASAYIVKSSFDQSNLLEVIRRLL